MRAYLVVAGLLFASPALGQVTVSIDPSADVHPISPLIYGVNFPADAQISEGRLTFSRWGGNSTSRYNYVIDVQNTASDYFFENIPGCWGTAGNCSPPPTDPQTNSGANAFLQQANANGMVALLTVPTLGWVAKPPAVYSQPLTCGCTAAGQGSYDRYDLQCGNGKDASGNWLSGACDPNATSMPVDAGWDGQWASYLVGKFGPSNGARIYELDNEPSLWSSTQHDVHPSPLTYDEEWTRMRNAALALLAADPTAQIAGPSEWGWPNYFCSDADDVSQGCFASSPDRAAHGGEELTAWLLDQAHAYQQSTGTRLLTYLDLHYYPQGGNPPDNLRSLWDPTYTDPSWINDTIRMIPRMRDWVAQHYPGTKISIGEYDWYHHDEPLGAIAYAEGLGIFGREGLDAATAWSAPDATQVGFAAFKLFRNYDGAGAAFGSTSVRATVSGRGVAAFAALGPGRLTAALINENASVTSVTLQLGSFTPAGATARWYSNQSTANIAAQPSLSISGGAIQVALPASSINMLVVDGSSSSGATGTSSGASSTGSSSSGSSSGSGASSGSSGSSPTPTGGTAGAGASSGGGGGQINGSSCQSAGGSIWLAWAAICLGLLRRPRGLGEVR
jgi:hypothetical protein